MYPSHRLSRRFGGTIRTGSITDVPGHGGAGAGGDCAKFGWSVGNPLIVASIQGRADGPLPTGTASFCRIDQPNVLLTALKRAEDSDGIVLRLTEILGRATKATVTLPHVTVNNARRTNVVEEDRGPAAFTQHGITVPLKAFGITTVRAEIERE